MKRFFLSYAKLRARQYILDSLNLYRRFLIVFFIAYSIALGNDTPAVNAAIGGLFKNRVWDRFDILVLVLFQIYALVAVAVTRKSLSGGRIQYLAQSLPLPMSWERAVRGINLSLMNSVVLFFTAFGLSTLLHDPPMFLLAVLLSVNFYLSLLNMQIQWTERRWISVSIGFIAGFLLLLSRGTGYLLPAVLLNLGLCYWSLIRRAQKPRPSNALVHAKHFQLRAQFLRRMPAASILQISYSLRKPSLLLYALMGGTVSGGILFMVMKQNIGLGQKIYVYSVINGFLSLLPAAYFATFNKLRDEQRIFILSLPQTQKTWLRLDLGFVIALFILVSLPTALLLIGKGYIPAFLPVISIPLLALRYLVFHRSTDPKEKSINAVTILYGSLLWFGAVGWLADRLLNP